MIYIDTSVALAHLLAKDGQPPASLWDETLFSSRQLEYEIWAPLRARGLTEAYGEAARWLSGQVAMLELSPTVLAQALDIFPGLGALPTLNALLLASFAYPADHGQRVALASYDRRMNAVDRAMDLPRSTSKRRRPHDRGGTRIRFIIPACRHGHIDLPGSRIP